MRRYLLILAMCVLPAFGGPCLPSGYFSDLLASAGSAVAGYFLSNALHTLFPGSST